MKLLFSLTVPSDGTEFETPPRRDFGTIRTKHLPYFQNLLLFIVIEHLNVSFPLRFW